MLLLLESNKYFFQMFSVPLKVRQHSDPFCYIGFQVLCSSGHNTYDNIKWQCSDDCTCHLNRTTEVAAKVATTLSGSRTKSQYTYRVANNHNVPIIQHTICVEHSTSKLKSGPEVYVYYRKFEYQYLPLALFSLPNNFG